MAHPPGDLARGKARITHLRKVLMPLRKDHVPELFGAAVASACHIGKAALLLDSVELLLNSV
jgi:hypothetical protein